MKHLRTLSDALPAHLGFNVIPEPRRTAEIDITLGGEAGKDHEIKVCLLSALMSSEQKPERGSIVQCSDRVEVLPLQIDPIKLLCVEEMGISGPVTVRDLVESGVTFLVPRGGVVWEFLNRSFPGWWKLRPFQLITVPDLDCGLKCLSSQLVPRSVMVVHGFDPDDQPQYGLANARLYDFATEGSHRLMAVTGVFHARQESTPVKPDPYDRIWATAQSLWSEKERTL